MLYKYTVNCCNNNNILYRSSFSYTEILLMPKLGQMWLHIAVASG
jgi:hypothetical protein